jgi:predicted MPP superfamily phosphohydrolase
MPKIIPTADWLFYSLSEKNNMTFLIIASLIYSAINFYVFYKGWRLLTGEKKFRTMYTICYLFMCFSFIIAMLGRNAFPLGILKFLYFPGTCWLGMLLYLVMFFLVTDLGFFIVNLIPKKQSPFSHSSKHLKKNFRINQILSGYFLVFMLSIYGYYHFNHPKIVEKNITISKKAGYFKELKIVGISDLHLGINLGKKQMKRYVKLINDQHPDLILIAGDINDNTPLPLEKEKMWEEFEQLHAPLGTYACLGNHEYMSDIEPSLAFINKTNIRLLTDEAALVYNSFWIIGRDDLQGNPKRKPLPDLLAKTDTTLPLILMDHEPYHLEEAEQYGIDFQFSGHTHDGQLWPGSLLVKKIYELACGYMKKGNTHYYVSSGLGLWGPLFRIGTDSELVVINIRFAE